MSPDMDLGGYSEVRVSAQVGSDGFPLKMVERVRPSFQAHPMDRLSVEAVVEGALTQGRNDVDEAATLLLASDIREALDEAGCTYTPADQYTSASTYLSVERLHVDLELPNVDFTIGRQSVAWGSSLIVHPTDPFPEVVATEPWKERRGINAIRAEIPIHDHSITALAAIDDDLSEFYKEEPDVSALPVTGALRGTLRALNTDWSAVAWGRPEGTWFAGADLRGTLGVGWWLEGGWHGGAESTHDDAAPLEGVVGIDYSIPVLSTLYLAAEYRYDGTGEDPDNYSWSARTSSLDVPFTGCSFSVQQGEDVPARTSLGRHYVHLISQLGFTQDIGVTGVALINLQDSTGFVSVDSHANVGSRWALHLGAQLPFGAEGEYRPPAEVTTVRVGELSADLSPLLYDANLLAWARYSF